MKTYITLFLLLSAGIFLGGSADEDTATAEETASPEADAVEEKPTEFVPRHPLTDMPPEADGVETSFLFPDNEDFSVVAGEKVELLGLFRNGGEVPLNVTAIMGSLNNPYDFRSYIQNYSFKLVNVQVPPGDDLSLSYTFTPDVHLQPRDFTVAVTVFYEGLDEPYSTTFFNSSLFIVEPPSVFDIETLFMYFFIAGVFGGIIFLVLRGLQSAGVVKKSKAKRVEVGASKDTSSENEWLQGTNAFFKEAAPKPKAKKVKKKN